jgi:hypothetical protein
MKKYRIELTRAELELVARTLTGSDRKEFQLLRRRFAEKLLKMPVDIKLLKSVDLSGMQIALNSVETQLMSAIINKISLLGGTPESQISQGSQLSGLGLTSFKLSQLRSGVNEFIRNKGGTVFIAENEMSAFKKVQDIFDRAITLIP